MNEPVPALPSRSAAQRRARDSLGAVDDGARRRRATRRRGRTGRRPGRSIAEFVGAPVRKVLEPAFDARADAAQDALVSFLDLTRVMVQEAIELVDINAVLEKVDIDALFVVST